MTIGGSPVGMRDAEAQQVSLGVWEALQGDSRHCPLYPVDGEALVGMRSQHMLEAGILSVPAQGHQHWRQSVVESVRTALSLRTFSWGVYLDILMAAVWDS